MKIHARIFECKNLDKQVLCYTDYNSDTDEHSIVNRFIVGGANVELRVGGIANLEKAREGLNNLTEEKVEKFVRSVLPQSMLEEEEEA